MGRAVLLRHELPDGSAHYDWMIQRGPGQNLITFRVSKRIDRAGVRGFGAERLADHRVTYLEYEGVVPGGRGEVRRVAEGALEIEQDGEGVFACRGRLGAVSGAFRGISRGSAWHFEVVGGV